MIHEFADDLGSDLYHQVIELASNRKKSTPLKDSEKRNTIKYYEYFVNMNIQI